MIHFERRKLLQVASAMAASALVHPLWADDTPLSDRPTTAADPLALFLTWQRDPTTTMTIQWIAAADNETNAKVWYAQDGAMDWHEAAVERRAFPMTDLRMGRSELRGLEPGTHYRFRLGTAGAEQRFRTMPAKATETITFVSGGDSGISADAQRTNAVAAAQDPMFVVIGGDLAYENGKDAKTFLKFLQNYSRQMIDSQRRLIPFVATIGNHEVNGGYGKPRSDAPFFYAVFDGLFPHAGYATLDFGQYLSLVLLDTNHTTP
ncbi:MAG TPA: metallophosphoesterase family protein, partial [Pirellulales bacterium]|nr:metallophosphoesterase family protein [Pirellulales bacterium]